MKKKINFILSVTLIFVLMYQPILVYANSVNPRLRNGYKWYDTPRNIYFKCDFENAEREAVRAAMNTWNAVKDPDGNSMVSMFLTTDEVYNEVEKTVSYNGWIGYCDILAIGDEIAGVKIQLDSNQKWSTTGEADAYDVQTVVLHELGHALGVAHCHEKSEGDGPCWSATCLTNVMNPSGKKGNINTTLKEYDTASYIVIYW